eukprot:CAMPEP_0179419702 /NCGR_PEP_ID=MMETSP0799-20121207/8751_1 /TAXON_ID=46947 /ORGANISM="Geminigera cryophila, Strain CCMP2564" /LENGTH=182 /DNA_ID=CAMNT_0021193215 /DNA_START=12 /DNA_END=557 /DNA_ORIENTATION=+
MAFDDAINNGVEPLKAGQHASSGQSDTASSSEHHVSQRGEEEKEEVEDEEEVAMSIGADGQVEMNANAQQMARHHQKNEAKELRMTTEELHGNCVQMMQSWLFEVGPSNWSGVLHQLGEPPSAVWAMAFWMAAFLVLTATPQNEQQLEAVHIAMLENTSAKSRLQKVLRAARTTEVRPQLQR